MTESEFKALNDFIDQINIDVKRAQDRQTITIVVDGPNIKTIPTHLHGSIVAAFESFQKEIMVPIMTDIQEKFKEHEFNDHLVDRIRENLGLKEGLIIASGGLSFKDEIKKRLGILHDPSRMKIEIDCIFETALTEK